MISTLRAFPGSFPSFAYRVKRAAAVAGAPRCLALRLDYDPGMAFNRRKMEAERKAKADAETAARPRGQRSGARGRRAPDRRLERAPGRANGPAVRADDRRKATAAALLGPKFGPTLLRTGWTCLH
jgi:hypothetical protein